MNDIIVSLAPTGPWGVGQNNPISPADLIKTAKECYNAGASVMHLHARDLQGNLTTDMTYLKETFAGIKGVSQMLIEASTGGLSNLTPEERGLPTTISGTDMGSLNLGSLNFGEVVYQNTPPSVESWIKQMSPCSVKPSLEIFDTGHIAYARSLIKEGKVKAPYNFSFIFNVKWGMVFSKTLLKYLVSQLPKKSNWGVIFIGSENFIDHLIAAENGANIIRVGFEDSNILDGEIVESNVTLVSTLRARLEKNGFKIIQGDIVRKTLLTG